jgi:hypothetical protein
VKWFKHDTDGHRSEGLLFIKEKYGREWVCRWFEILEMVAEKMDETDRCHLELPVSEWCKRLDCTAKKLSSFLEDGVKTLSLAYEQRTETLVIIIPNLLKKRDKYSSDMSREKSETYSQKKIQIQSKEEDTEKEENPPVSAYAETTPPPSGEEPPPAPKPEKKIPDHISATVKIWNDSKAETWDYVHDPAKIPGLVTRITAARKIDGFYLPEIIARARESDFLNSKRFCTLLWLVSKSKTTGKLNAQDVNDGKYDNRTITNSKSTPDTVREDGDDGSRSFAERTKERENRPIPEF